MKELPVIACSLTAEQLPARGRRWRALPVTERVETAVGVRLTFRAEPGVEQELRALADLERDCCGFASFDVSRCGDLVLLAVSSAGDGVTAVREIFS